MFYLTNCRLNSSIIDRTGWSLNLSCLRMNKMVSWTWSESIRADWPMSLESNFVSCGPDCCVLKPWAKSTEERVARWCLFSLYYWENSKKLIIHCVSHDACPVSCSMNSSRELRHVSTTQNGPISSIGSCFFPIRFGSESSKLLVKSFLAGTGFNSWLDWRKYLMLKRQQTSGTGVLHY